ncbi:AGAP012977-PA-like protein [Anopheles sinensis]|uniref:AGAP012977-PA-like protein n=1 Tax=Anopheles sinensis TaxID=74873 RepID=A0A084WTL7_ANOSI|nr:AGAP012977-PA-like protein [Anopheles sinensis]
MSSKLAVTLADKSPVCYQACPFRVSSQVTVVDDSDKFVPPENPLDQLASVSDGPATHAVSTIEWYRSRSHAFGTTRFTCIESLLKAAELQASETIKLDFNRCGYTNLHVQIALDTLLNRIRPQCLTELRLCRNRLFNPSLAQVLGNVLQEFQTIAYLSISFNTLDDDCIGILGDALSNSGVRTFEANHCQITDKGGSLFFTAMTYSDCIESIQLNWNHLGMASGVAIGKFLSVQRSLVELSLSGNHLYPESQSIVPLLQGLIGNEMLEGLELSWNGLRGEDFGRALVKAVPQSKLKRLNLEHNLLASEEMMFLVRMLKKSETLLELRLGGNSFEEESSQEIVRTAGRHTSLVLLSFGRFHFVSQRTAKLCEFFKRKTPSKQFTYQGVLLANPPRPVDLQEMLLERCRFLAMKPKKAKLKRDVGHLMLQFKGQQNAVLTRDEFLLAMKQFGAKLDRALIDALMDAFAAQKGYVDTGTMAEKYLSRHPTDPPEKAPKATKGKSNKKK